MAGTRYHCPVDNCRYYLDEADDAVDSDLLKSTMGLNVYQATSKRGLVNNVESRLQEHLALHKPIEFLVTIASLREEIVRLKSGRG